MQDFSETFFDELIDVKDLKKKRKNIEPILKEVRKFFSENKIVLYGGTAINLHLPKKLRFYNNAIDIPDYDGYSLNAKPTALNLFHKLVNRKYQFLLVKHALHEGTYKLSWEFKDIADITQINKNTYNFILKTSKTVNGLYIANVNLLKSNGYIELAMPKSSLFRWKKVFSRIKLLEKAHPLKIPQKSLLPDEVFTRIDLPPVVSELLQEIYNFILINRLPIVGVSAMRYHLNLSKDSLVYNIGDLFRLIHILSINVYDTVHQIKKIISKYKNVEFKETNLLHDSDIIQGKISIDIFYEKKIYKIVSIFDSNSRCISTHETKSGYLYVSKFFLLHLLYYYILKFDNEHTYKMKFVVIELLKTIKKNNFSTDCYGVNQALTLIKKQKFKKRIPAVIKAF